MTTKDVYRFDATWYEPTDDGKGGSRKFSDACVRAADYDADLASVEADRDSLQVDSTRAITVVAGLIAERDEWRRKFRYLDETLYFDGAGMMAHEDCGPTIEVHSKKVGELIAERDALRAKGEKLADAILACKALFVSVLEEWRKS
jgi:hypothetical protein